MTTREYPLSPAQRGQWFVAEAVPDSPAYNIAWALRLRGQIDLAELRRAVHKVVERHEPLRTRFVIDRGECVQQVVERSALPDPVTVESDAGPVEAAIRRAASLATKPFDLRAGGLLRVWVQVSGPDDHLLVFSTHHIVFDGWSSQVFERDLAEYYRSALTGAEPRLPPLPVSYGEYAAALRAREESGYPEEIAYWQRQLAGFVPFGLPEDIPRPATLTLRGDRVTFQPPRNLFDQLAAITRGRRATPYLGFLAALAILLYRLSGRSDVLVGSSALGRPTPELADLVGHFVDSLVLRIQVRPWDTFQEVVDQARSVVLAAHQHDSIPFDLLVRKLHPPRDLSRNPFFQINLNYLDEAVTRPVTFPGASVEPYELPMVSTHFDLSFSIVVRPGVLDCAIDFSTDLFRPATIRTYAEGLEAVITNAVRAPDTRVAQLSLIPAGGYEELLTMGTST